MRLPESITWREALIRQACAYRFIREYAGANAGEGVEWCQHATGNRPPDYWCMSFVSRVGVETFGRAWPLLMTGSCEEQRAYLARKGALRTRAEFDFALARDPASVLGWVGLLVDMSTGKPHAHHTFFVGAKLHIGTADEALAVRRADGGRGFYCTEGNAADPKDPSSRNGNGAYTGRIRGSKSDAGLYVFGDLAAL
jgi:hypothetical protein